LGNSLARKSRTFWASGGAGGVLDAGVDVLGVLPEDHHVDLLGVLHRAGDAGEVLDRPQADVEVEHLPEGDVQGADAAADRGGQRALDADQELLEGFDGVVGQPVVEALEALLAGEDLHPGDLAGAAVGLGTAASKTRTEAPRCPGRCRHRG
jgi:hypothetical protein